MVSWLPLYHDMGLVGCLLLAVSRPGPLTLIPPEVFLARPAIWLRAISRKRATISVAPNFAYGLCVRRVRDPEMEGVDLSSWRFALNGAEPVAPAVLRRFSERFAPNGFDGRALMPVYGLSEASLAVAFTPSGRGPRTWIAGGRHVWVRKREVPLTAKEYALLEYLARRLGDVVSRADIAEHVWDEHYDPLSNVIDVYVQRLRRKVDLPGQESLIRTRRGEGYQLRGLP